MYSVLNIDGAVTGYLIGDYYLSVDMARWFFHGFVSVKPIYGMRRGTVVIARVNNAVLKAFTPTAENYMGFLSDCISDKMDMQDVVFVPCKVDNCILAKDNGIWRVPRCSLYQCMHGVKTLGYLLLNKRLYGSKEVVISMMEMLQPGKGHGSMVIRSLKSQGVKLSGMSVVDAMSFWKKNGAVFGDCNRFQIG